MVFFGKRKRELPGRLVIALAFYIFINTLLAAQESGTEVEGGPEEESPRITVEVSPEKIIVGQRFDLTIFGDFPSYRMVRISEPPLPDGISLAGGPYKSAQTIRVGDLGEARYIKKTRVYYKFKVDKPGIYTIGSFTLSDGETTLETEPVIFPAVSFDERNYKYPVFANWYALPEEVMVGETFPLILEMENLESLTFPDNVQMSPPAGGMFERVNSLGEITVKEIGDDEVYLAPIDSWLYTPTVTGRLKIPAASVLMGKITRSTSSHYVNVVPVPAEIEGSGAIGSFTLSAEIENLPPRKGRESILRIRVEGEGNLNYLIMPGPEFSGLTVIDKEEQFEYSPSQKGYSGFREDVYRLQAGEESELSITFPSWNWFDRSSGTLEGETLKPFVAKNVLISSESTGLSFLDEFSPLSSGEILSQRKPFYNISLYYLLVLPGLVSIITALVRNRYSARLSVFSMLFVLLVSSSAIEVSTLGESLEKAKELWDNQEIEEALVFYNQAIVELPENSALFYNRALMEYDLDMRGASVFSLRKALNLKPGSSLYRRALVSLEGEYGLERQVRASSGLSPDLFFLLFILLFNGGALTISFNIRKRKIELSIFIIMVFFLSLVSLSIVIFTDQLSKSDTAITMVDQGELRKVPGDLGSSWLTLQEGTAVHVLSRSDDSLLIRTGYGLEGWINKDSLIFLNEGE